MRIDFDAMEETAIPRFRDGEKTTYARMFVDGNNRILAKQLRGKELRAFVENYLNNNQ